MSVTFGCSSVYAIVTTLNYDFVDFLLFGLTWILISLIWCYHCCIVAYYFPGYFFIVCYYLKLRLKTFVKRLKIFKTSLKRYPNMAKLLKVKLLLEEHNDLCKQIHHYNIGLVFTPEFHYYIICSYITCIDYYLLCIHCFVFQ